jgi:hypothetical protein
MYPGGNWRWVATTTPVSITTEKTKNALDMMCLTQVG